MKQYFYNLGIQSKLLIAFMSIVLLSVVLVIVTFSSISKVTHYKDVTAKINSSESQFGAINGIVANFIYEGRKEKGFLETGTSGMLEAYQSDYNILIESIQFSNDQDILEMTNTQGLVSKLKSSLKDYDATLREIVALCAQRGFKDHGMEGALRQSIHDVEKADFEYDKSLMLMLRRHEKDFFLRHDLKYQDKFHKGIDAFISHINALELDKEDGTRMKELAIANINNYRIRFDQIVEIEQKIGIGNNVGYKKRLEESKAQIFPVLQELRTTIQSRSEKLVENGISLIAIIFGVQFVIGVALAIIYSRIITQRIREIKDVMVTLSEGKLTEPLEVASDDELGETKGALNNLVKRIEAAVQFATDLGNGQLDKAYDDQFHGDVLAKAIMAMQEKLRLADKKQERINWSNKGLAHFSEIFQTENLSAREFGDKVLEKLARYTQLNQAALYSLEEDTLTRIATYAYDKKKYLNEKIAVGQGLVGQCVLEKESIFMTDVPADYVEITSGLGMATPTNIYIIPLMVGQNVLGVLELASFKILEDYQREFIEKLAGSIGTVLNDVSTTEQTKELLTSTQEQAERLQQQEEEMKQQMEEMLATQEEMEMQRIELQQEIDALRKKLAKKSKDGDELDLAMV